MKKNSLFNVLVVAALALMVALTIQGALQTAKVAMAAGASDQANLSAGAPLCDFPAIERESIHRVYIEQMNTWVTYTDSGPTGVDGGLIHLLSDTGTCAQ